MTPDKELVYIELCEQLCALNQAQRDHMRQTLELIAAQKKLFVMAIESLSGPDASAMTNAVHQSTTMMQRIQTWMARSEQVCDQAEAELAKTKIDLGES